MSKQFYQDCDIKRCKACNRPFEDFIGDEQICDECKKHCEGCEDQTAACHNQSYKANCVAKREAELHSI